MDASHQVEWWTEMLIGGESRTGDGPIIEVGNPATEERLVSLKGASREQIDDAVSAARNCFESGIWRDPHLRSDLLMSLADLMERDVERLTKMVVLEVGTPVSLCASLQVAEPIGLLRYYAEQTEVDRSRHLVPGVGASACGADVRFEPSGVVAAVTAYNYPILFAALKLGASLAAGCTTVVLPSFQAPLSTL
jgi:aldehyde dehydrogenase (NAD+)/betaine-aldehyde dehydrogenase